MTVSPKDAARFWSKVERRAPDECWPWRGGRRGSGYGSFSLGGKPTGAHRVSWRLANGIVPPPSMLVCHHCDNPPCVNPAHLFLGTPSDNMRDCWSKGRAVRSAPIRQASKTHCRNGHPYSGDNLVIRKTGFRECLICKRANNRRWKAGLKLRGHNHE